MTGFHWTAKAGRARSTGNFAPLISLVRVAWLAGCVYLAAVPAHGFFLQNGDFSEGLAVWESQGSVADTGGLGVLTDDGASYSALAQAVDAGPASFTISFDIRNLLSEAVPAGRVADTFFATVYLADDSEGFSMVERDFEAAIPLFGLDADGAFDILAGGAFSESAKGSEWQHFSATFDSAHGFAMPAFELFNLNGVVGDSVVAVDNVALVPEPSVVWLLVVGLIILLWRRRANVAPVSQPAVSPCFQPADVEDANTRSRFGRAADWKSALVRLQAH
jgi:hypothetical protein